ncbi:MAG: hypothetical protein OEM02_11630 [Desulfobulbaceae bacterium]|nr:hypothetical protein [Desulfobulbaceae bacterium]
MQIDWGHFSGLVYDGTLRKLYILAMMESLPEKRLIPNKKLSQTTGR